MKNPEEIKKGLELCSSGGRCIDCDYFDNCYSECIVNMAKDALAYIEQLDAELEKTRAQLTAALNDLKDADRYGCDHCANYSELPEEKCDEAGGNCGFCNEDCPCRICEDNSNWAWRGERK